MNYIVTYLLIGLIISIADVVSWMWAYKSLGVNYFELFKTNIALIGTTLFKLLLWPVSLVASISSIARIIKMIKTIKDEES